MAAAVVTKVGFREDCAGSLASLPDELDVWCERKREDKNYPKGFGRIKWPTSETGRFPQFFIGQHSFGALETLKITVSPCSTACDRRQHPRRGPVIQ